MRLWWILGAIFGGLSVALGAFGAHGLKGRVTEDLLRVFETGARYQMYHALALFLVAIAAKQASGPLVSTAGGAFVAGILLFSGSLYLMTFTGQRWLGAITPLGGVSFLIGWALLAYLGYRHLS